MPRRSVWPIVLGLTLAGALVAPAARADLLNEEDDFGFVRFEAFGTIGTLPALALNGGDTPRSIVGAPAPGSSPTWRGFGGAFAVRDDFLVWDVFSVRYSATNEMVTGTSVANGQPFSVTAYGFQTIEFGLPFFGVPAAVQLFLGHKNNFKLDFAYEWGPEHLWGSAQTNARGAPSASISDWGWFFRLSFSACGKLGRWTDESPASWLCFNAAPKVVDGNGATGVSIGARLEL